MTKLDSQILNEIFHTYKQMINTSSISTKEQLIERINTLFWVLETK